VATPSQEEEGWRRRVVVAAAARMIQHMGTTAVPG
jgi:GrpB-like predicted nucleotidyltransferase (UPF0157 family)